MRFRKIVSGLTSLALSLTAFTGIGLSSPVRTLEASAATVDWKFDLGGGGTAGGYTGVSATQGYNAGTGYGFSGSVANVAAGGSGALSDAVQFTGGQFNVDLPKGLYQVTVTTGNVSRTSIMVEGMLQMINLTGNNAVESIQVPVTDGQLNISAVAGRANTQYSISAIDITQLNTTGEMKPTVWICGDSTVANYYNTADTAQHGWGQYLGDYINTNVFEVRNQASSGQYAKGFVDGGQFDAIKTYGKPGDYYIISIGINDTNYSNGEEYYSVVTDMVKVAKNKGMNVILVKQQGRHGDLSRSSLLGGRWFGGQLDQIGTEQNVTVIDDFTAWQNFGLSIGGYDAMTPYYADGDDLHQSKLGAQKNAEIMQSLMKIGDTEMDTSQVYTFKNTNSGLVMDIADGTMAEGSNVQQWGSNDLSCQQWTLTPFANGTTYYYVHSVADPNYVLKAMSGDNGGNIEIVPYSGSDSMMLFQFTKIGDGSYYISTRSSRDACFVEVDSASTSSGANVQQWGMTYSKCQNWQAVTVTTTTPATTTSTETTTTTTATTAPVTTTEYVPETSEVIVTMTGEPRIVKRPGDVNEDGNVDMSDTVAIMRWYADASDFPLSEQGRINGDIAGNNDGLTNLDALFIQRIEAGLEELPPVEYGDPEIITSVSIVTLAPVTTTTAVTTAADPFAGLYYAVDQTWDDGWAESNNEGFTKTEASMGTTGNIGFVNLNNVEGSSLTFTVNTNIAGNYYTAIRYANGSTIDRKTRVIVNGNTQEYWLQSFTGTGSWTSWLEVGIVLPLNAGQNTIQFVSAVSEGGPNFDYISLTLTDEPVAEIYDPNSDPHNISSDLPTIYIAGDSTVQNYRESYAPQQGWGYYLGNYFTDGVSVANHSIAGRSSKSFYDQGRFAAITESLKQGDYVMIQFAINDADYTKSERYAPTCGNVNSPTEGSYEWYMTSFIKDTMAKGATPILVTTVIGMKAYSNGKFVNSYTNYCDACKQLAAKYSIPCIDLNTIMVNHYNSIGYDAAKLYHLIGVVEGSTDGTHFCETGANVVAGLVAKAVKDQQISGLSSYVK